MTREEASLKLHEYMRFIHGTISDKYYGEALKMAVSALQQPEPPERNKGKWNFIGDQMFECTECGACYTQNQFHQMQVRIVDPEFPNFCPNCGADMRGGKADD